MKRLIKITPIEEFENEKKRRIDSYKNDVKLKEISHDWIIQSYKHKYVYNFSWLGRPIIQFPQDMIVWQELIWKIKPDLIIETGIAHGGSLILSASILEILKKGEVVGIDIDIRKHNRQAIEQHPLFNRINLIEGSSVDLKIIEKIRMYAKNKQSVLVGLDSNHTHEHVVEELKLFSPFVTKGSYIVVFDTYVENLPNEFHENRPWARGNNPKTAVKKFLMKTDRFVVDDDIEAKLLITSAPSGFLKRIK